MKRKIYIWAIALASLISTNSLAQNAITLDPKTTGTNDARTLSEGVGSTSQNLWQFKTPTYSSWWFSRLGIKSFTTTSSSDFLTAIYGLADKSTTRNIGIYGGAGAEGSAIAYGGHFSAFGSTTSSTYGLFSTVHNQGNGSVYGGYFSIYNLSNEGRGNKYGVYIFNNAFSDTTTAGSRYGLYSLVGGKSRFGNYGIYSNVESGDTVTVKNSSYALYGSIRQKNTNTNYGLAINATNIGTGQAIAGEFNVNSGSKTSVGNRTAIQARNISGNSDTTTVNNRYGVNSIINGRTKFDNIAIYGQNSNYSGDTLTATTRYGISGSASGKSKFQNIGIRGNASTNSGTTASATGVQGSAYSGGSGSATGGDFWVYTQSSTTGVQYGIRTSAANGSSTNNSALYGASLFSYSNGNNYSQALYADGYGTNSSTGIIHGIRSSASSNNSGNINPTYGIYTTASGSSQGMKYGIYATSSGSGGQFAGYFQGNVHVAGSLSQSVGTFKIDHPQDPENKYLVHSFVESPEMKNIYDGTITTDANGDASILMPSYFQSLNVTFRYQLTCMGQFAQAIVSEEITNNSFKIKTDKPNVKVSWQVTGVRNDPSAQSNPIVVEQSKTGVEKGKYLNPAAYKKAENMGIHTLANTNNQTAAEREVEAKAMQTKMEQEQKQREEEQARQLSENLKEKAEAEQAEQHRKAEQKRREEEIEKNSGETKSN